MSKVNTTDDIPIGDSPTRSFITIPTAIVGAAIILSCSIIVSVWLNGRFRDHYEISAIAGPDTSLGWRLNKQTGVVTVCELAKSDDPFLIIMESQREHIRDVDKIMVQCGRE